ncbi:MAG: hydroxyacylglutathione hydrolase [Thermodesulfobacteriota bacterium]
MSDQDSIEELIVKTIAYSSDNYCYLIHHPLTGKTALVDCGEAESVLRYLKREQWKLDVILLTHYHYDHTAGTSRVIKAFPNATIYSPLGEERIGFSSVKVKDGDEIPLGPLEVKAVSVPAHTRYCTNYYIRGHIFVSDTFFSAGCGRVFEGTALDLEKAMDRLASLPPETLIYFGHEYTLDNLRFAISVEPDNPDIIDYISKCQRRRGSGEFTTPTTLAQELKINPFLRIDHENVIKFIDPSGVYGRTERIGLLRKAKDKY